MPLLFVPAISGSFLFSVMIIVYLVVGKSNLKTDGGSDLEGYDHDMYVSLDEEIDPVILEGFKEPFQDFVMESNGQHRFYRFGSNTESVDQKFYKLTLAYMKKLRQHKAIGKFKTIKNYSYVVSALRQSNYLRSLQYSLSRPI